MKLNEYQERAMSTCLPSCENTTYMLLNLVGEVGEFASKIAKAIRKGQASIGLDPVEAKEYEGEDVANDLFIRFDDDESRNNALDELKKEAGDILWQLSGLCTVMRWSLEDVAQTNLDKLAARKAAGTIVGNGDGIIREK